MLQIAEELGWPELYKDDLYKHDKEDIQEILPNEPFVWMIRETGTTLIRLGSYSNYLKIKDCHKAWGDDAYRPVARNLRWYAWDGEAFHEALYEGIAAWAHHYVLRREQDKELLYARIT
jgi:hypothetical protein